MLLLVSGATSTIKPILADPHLGLLVTPRSGNSVDWIVSTCKPWAADNDAFKKFDPPAFCRMLSKIAGKPGCLFVACPDVVGDARLTADQFYTWHPVLKQLGLPVALVLQDGQASIGVPWNMVDALFVGGSTEFKLGRVAASLVREGKARGKWIHCGRVNTRQRFRYAAFLGCDSCDGTAFSRFPAVKIPRAQAWLDDIDRQGTLSLAA